MQRLMIRPEIVRCCIPSFLAAISSSKQQAPKIILNLPSSRNDYPALLAAAITSAYM